MYHENGFINPIYLTYMHKEDLALNNLLNQTKQYMCIKMIWQ